MQGKCDTYIFTYPLQSATPSKPGRITDTMVPCITFAWTTAAWTHPYNSKQETASSNDGSGMVQQSEAFTMVMTMYVTCSCQVANGCRQQNSLFLSHCTSFNGLDPGWRLEQASFPILSLPATSVTVSWINRYHQLWPQYSIRRVDHQYCAQCPNRINAQAPPREAPACGRFVRIFGSEDIKIISR